jgi:hypothetical protein
MQQDMGEAPLLERGVVVGRYRVIGQLAVSRSSRLYEVEHELMGTPGVLKTGAPGFALRVRREASLLAMLESPHIPGLLQIGGMAEQVVSEQPFELLASESAQQATCFVMQRAPGKTLRDLLRRQRRLDPVLAVRIALDVVDALRSCHERGIVHGDVKPENILVSETNGRVHAMLIDFGAASVASDAGAELQPMTTPLYAAPERLEGAKPSVSSDVYSLACVVYEAVCGKAPRALSAEGSLVALDEVVPTSADLARLLDAGLSSDPKRRPASAQAFADALGGLQVDELVATGGLGGDAAPAQQDLDTLELAEISADPPQEAMASRPWVGDHSGLLSVTIPTVWLFSGDPGTDQARVVDAAEMLSERYRVEWLDADARANKRVELLSGVEPPWVIVFGDLHVLLGEPLLEEARRQGETSRLLISTHANWELLDTSVNACGLHAQLCLPSDTRGIVERIDAMVERARELRRSYDGLRLALRDAEEDLSALQQHSS